MSDRYDVAVVGSGPAGSSAALRLANSGVNVITIEKASLPRYKTCGGGVVRRAVKLLPLNVQKAVKQYCYSAEVHLIDFDLCFSTTREEPIISMTMREDFDFLILSAARDAGAVIQSDCEVLDIVQQSDLIKLVTSKGDICSKFLIAADGAMGNIARKAGWQETRKLIPALECEIFVEEEELKKYNHSARFDFGVIPHGYGWIFPKADHFSAGVLSMRRGDIDLPAILRSYLLRIDVKKIVQMEQHGFLIPVSPRKERFTKGRVLLVGDAAGFADPITGEGITFAIQTGLLAAKALLEGKFDKALVQQIYQSELEKYILPELRSGSFLSKFVYTSSTIRNWLFRKYGQKLTDAVTDVLMGEKTYSQMLRDPKNYLKLLKYF